MSTVDRSGYSVSAAEADTVERYDRAVDSLLRFSDDVVDAWSATVADAPEFAMGHIGLAYLACLSSEGPDAAAARDVLEPLGDGGGLHDREQQHLAAAHAYANGDFAGASELLALLTVEYPRDALAIQIGHQLDFFSGDALTLRDRVGRALMAWDSSDPRYGYLQGMFAFGLEECGLYPQAADAGTMALERDRRDVWALHAVVHTHEMRGLVDEGLAMLDARRSDWTTGNIFVVHNSWHESLFLLELGEVERVLAGYDAVIHNDRSEKLAIEMLDASALLWRLYLDDIDTGGRWNALADAWAEKDPDPWYAFNDMHATMAFVGAGRLDDAHAAVDRLAAYAVTPRPEITNVAMTTEVGLPVCAAVLAFGEARYDDVVSLLHPIRKIVQRFGGSHAQRDAVARTLLEAAIRGGHTSLARALVSERLAVRESSRYARRQLERLDGAGIAATA